MEEEYEDGDIGEGLQEEFLDLVEFHQIEGRYLEEAEEAEMDPEVLAALEDAEGFDELEDDFVFQAMGLGNDLGENDSGEFERNYDAYDDDDEEEEYGEDEDIDYACHSKNGLEVSSVEIPSEDFDRILAEYEDDEMGEGISEEEGEDELDMDCDVPQIGNDMVSGNSLQHSK
jgi:hypothetical protein